MPTRRATRAPRDEGASACGARSASPVVLPHRHLHISASPHLEQRSLLRSRGAFSRPGSASLCPSAPNEGRAERRQAHIFVWPRGSPRDRPRLSRRGAPRSGGTLASRRSAVAILGPGPRFHLRHFGRIRSASSSQPGRSAWRAGSRTSRGRRLRAAAAGRHSPLGLQDRL
jgi:hypothetical protein